MGRKAWTAVLATAGLGMLGAACGESPTGPEEGIPEVNQNPLQVPGIEVTVEEDDPWTCAESPTCSGFPGSGSGGSGSGDGGGGSGSGDGGGGGSSGTPDLPDPDSVDTDCDPAVEDCLQPLEVRHHEAIQDFRELMEETDYESEMVEDVCKVLLSEFDELYPENVFVGNPSIPDSVQAEGSDQHAGPHDALWVENDDGTESIHLDGDYFDAAIEAGDTQGIGLTLLHESAHGLADVENWGQHDGEGGPIYTSFPYSHTSTGTGSQRTSGPERCVKK